MKNKSTISFDFNFSKHNKIHTRHFDRINFQYFHKNQIDKNPFTNMYVHLQYNLQNKYDNEFIKIIKFIKYLWVKC